MSQTVKYLYPALAAVLTILFVVTAGSICNMLYLGVPDPEGNLDYFRQDMLVMGLATPVSLLIAGVAWAFAVLFYYIINSVKFDRWWNWLTVLTLVAVITGIFTGHLLTSKIGSANPAVLPSYEPYIRAMGAWGAVLGAVLFAIASMGIRHWSSNCRHTPFPQ